MDLVEQGQDGHAPHHPDLGRRRPHSLADASPLTPQQAADAALKAITPSTKVSTDGTAVVAGRSAYELLLEPRDPASLVGLGPGRDRRRTHVPTRVQVFGSDTAKPALEVGFTSFDPTRPDASVFRFNPPPGHQGDRGVHREGRRLRSRDAVRQQRVQDSKPQVVGSGWTSVLVAQAPALPQDRLDGH